MNIDPSKASGSIATGAQTTIFYAYTSAAPVYICCGKFSVLKFPRLAQTLPNIKYASGSQEKFEMQISQHLKQAILSFILIDRSENSLTMMFFNNDFQLCSNRI